MTKILCFFGKHKDGKKEISYIDEYGNHYMSKCLRCGDTTYYKNEAEEEATEHLINEMYYQRKVNFRRRLGM